MNNTNFKYNVGDWTSYSYGQSLMIGQIMYADADNRNYYIMHNGHVICENSILECRGHNT